MTTPAIAQQAACFPSPIWVVYVNGIQNDPGEATRSGLALEAAHGPLVSVSQPTQYALLYNPSGNLGRDLLESAYQSLPQMGVATLTEFFETLFGLRPQSSAFQAALHASVERFATLTNVAPEAEWIRSLHGYYHTAIFAGTTGQGLAGPAGGIVVVAHSQGNFFANLTYADSLQKNRLRIVGVATPDYPVGGGGPYFTAQEDLFAQLFIAARRAAGQTYSPPNTSLGWPVSQLSIENMLGHSFEKAYLNSQATTMEVVAAVESARQSIGYAPQNPSACATILRYTGRGNMRSPGSGISTPGPLRFTVHLREAVPNNFTGYLNIAAMVSRIDVQAEGAESVTLNAQEAPNHLNLYYLNGVPTHWALQITARDTGPCSFGVSTPPTSFYQGRSGVSFRSSSVGNDSVYAACAGTNNLGWQSTQTRVWGDEPTNLSGWSFVGQ
jgi:hypothetical protein